MPFHVTPNAFSTEAEAVAAVEAAGLHSSTFDIDDNSRDLHWHDFDAIIGIVEGQLEVTDEAGQVITCDPGSLLKVTDRPLHSERTTRGRFVFGFDVDVDQLERPINRTPETHPSR